MKCPFVWSWVHPLFVLAVAQQNHDVIAIGRFQFRLSIVPACWDEEREASYSVAAAFPGVHCCRGFFASFWASYRTKLLL